jgi:hypothetical protein
LKGIVLLIGAVHVRINTFADFLKAFSVIGCAAIGANYHIILFEEDSVTKLAGFTF